MSQNAPAAVEAWQEVHEQFTEATIACLEASLDVQAALTDAWLDAVEEHTTEVGGTAPDSVAFVPAPAVWIDATNRFTDAIAPARAEGTPAESAVGDAAVSSPSTEGSDTTPTVDPESEQDAEEPPVGAPPKPGESVPTGADILQNALDGVGPTYGERLVERGFDSIAAVAVAHPGDLIEATEATETRVSGWQEQARRQL